MRHSTRTGIALSALLLIAVLCFTGVLIKQRHTEPETSVIPGLEKTRYVFMHMTPKERQQDSDYGSVYSTAEQAKAALASNPADAKAHRTLARSYVNAMYSDQEYLASDVNTLHFHEVENHLLAPAIAEYQAALQADPNNPVTKYNLAAAYSQAGEPVKSLALYEQVKEYPPLTETAEGAIWSLQTRIAQGSKYYEAAR